MALLDEWDSVLRDDPGCTDVLQHDIDTGDAPPFRSTPYQVPAKWRDAVKAELEQLKEQGILVPSVSRWSSPIVPVAKKEVQYEYVLTSGD